jgi:hypothetical protein
MNLRNVTSRRINLATGKFCCKVIARSRQRAPALKIEEQQERGTDLRRQEAAEVRCILVQRPDVKWRTALHTPSPRNQPIQALKRPSAFLAPDLLARPAANGDRETGKEA